MENRKITFTNEDAEKLENFVYYYAARGVENIQEKHPGFVVDDLTDILIILSHAFDLDIFKGDEK